MARLLDVKQLLNQLIANGRSKHLDIARFEAMLGSLSSSNITVTDHECDSIYSGINELKTMMDKSANNTNNPVNSLINNKINNLEDQINEIASKSNQQPTPQSNNTPKPSPYNRN